MISISWHRLARQELFEASDFYDAEARGLGDAFLDSVEHALGQLKAHPRAGRFVVRDVRSYVVSRFPYSIVYRIAAPAAPLQSQLFILAVAHHRRRPRYWSGRLDSPGRLPQE